MILESSLVHIFNTIRLQSRYTELPGFGYVDDRIQICCVPIVYRVRCWHFEAVLTNLRSTNRAFPALYSHGQRAQGIRDRSCPRLACKLSSRRCPIHSEFAQRRRFCSKFITTLQFCAASQTNFLSLLRLSLIVLSPWRSREIRENWLRVNTFRLSFTNALEFL